ncbi:MAG: hemerythrin domain-containing protein [Alphaproteobacteria bacterium]|nr:hemerythrin domain-containing protein [Alphaproteobacteria bacterium]MBU1527486.1 hemerythrin domain-containing protein [Alphaproteobacteria bacterium]MBU2116682.1 hemerythrin domain-containing protein [Alphaproteobacteria bacterium]MBU2352644.1 hemerythrin domain-containing protein [Alphaproteobacteria bacterium]MBU2383019.1 hemerythrin domain-containing protein [Alphaproteobacteria bacterium]
MDTGTYRAEHRRILRRAAELRGWSQDVRTAGDADQARAMILRLDLLISRHLAREDTQFYPHVQRQGDARMKAMADEAVADMGGLAGAWAAFVAASGPGEMLQNPSRFRSCCASVLGALAARIEDEEERLYPMAESLPTAEAGA